MQASTPTGMPEGRFWRSVINDNPLVLRKPFAFFDFDYDLEGDRTVSQSDVYFPISAILHNLRNNFDEAGQKLFQHEHRHSLLAPETFQDIVMVLSNHAIYVRHNRAN